MKKSIVWLASYPKSGNTWLRIFLANYLSNAEEPMSINDVHRYGMGNSIAKTYHMVAGRQIDVSDTARTVALRDRVLRGIVANNADVNLVKTHNIRRKTRQIDLIPDKYTRSAIYIMRNPLDMVLSYARHFAMPIEDAVEAISRSDNANAADASTVAVFLGSWSEHVRSWTRLSPYPLQVLKYEDMLSTPEEEFGKVIKHLGLPVDAERLTRAIRFSSFRELKKQEEDKGFVEKSRGSKSFFAKGSSGQWKSDLSQDLIDRIREDHRQVMQKYGYLE